MSDWLAKHMDECHRPPADPGGWVAEYGEGSSAGIKHVHDDDHDKSADVNIVVDHTHSPLGTFLWIENS